MRILRKLAVAAAATGLALTGAFAAAPAAQAARHAPFCSTFGFNTFDKFSNFNTRTSLEDVNTTETFCYDRVVFDFDNLERGFNVRYTNFVPSQGRGLNLTPYTAGRFYLNVTLRGDTDNRFDARVGEHLGDPFGFRTLRDVVYGGSFENRTTFAVGLNRRVPFRVLQLSGDRLALDVLR